MEAEARFRALFEEVYPALFRYARHRGLSKADAEDLVAGVLETVWRRLDDVPADDPLPWCYAVARNYWRNLVRANGRRQVMLDRLGGLPLVPQEFGASLDTSDGEALRQALGQLDEDDQELLRLVAWEGLSPTQASVVLGCSAVAARTRLHRARKRLASHLDADWLQRLEASGQRTECADA